MSPLSLPELYRLLTARNPRPVLRPTGPWKPELRSAIDAPPLAAPVRAALHLWNDDLAAGHRIAQEEESPDGCWCHAVVHRREGDFANARYWYRRAGAHPAFEKMRGDFPDWDPVEFTRWCEAEKKPLEQLEKIQSRELEWLVGPFPS